MVVKRMSKVGRMAGPLVLDVNDSVGQTEASCTAECLTAWCLITECAAVSDSGGFAFGRFVGSFLLGDQGDAFGGGSLFGRGVRFGFFRGGGGD